MFPTIDAFGGLCLGVDFATLAPGRVAVIESPRRLRRQASYGFIHALWWAWLEDGRSAVSVSPGAADSVTEIVAATGSAQDMFDPALAARLKVATDAALLKHGLGPTDRVLSDLVFACDAASFRRQSCGHCQHLADGSIPAADGIRLPDHCFPDGIAFGVIADGKVVSVAYAHRTGIMEDRVADLGVETAPGWRRRGHAKTAVSAVVEHILRAGGEARYGCRQDNRASVATARSVGFVPYGRQLILTAPATDG